MIKRCTNLRLLLRQCHITDHHHTTTVLRPFFWDHPGEPVQNFWTLWYKGR